MICIISHARLRLTLRLVPPFPVGTSDHASTSPDYTVQTLQSVDHARDMDRVLKDVSLASRTTCSVLGLGLGPGLGLSGGSRLSPPNQNSWLLL